MNVESITKAFLAVCVLAALVIVCTMISRTFITSYAPIYTHAPAFCQDTQQQITALEQKIREIEQGIDDHWDRLVMLQSKVDFIQATNSSMEGVDVYQIVQSCYDEARRYNLDPFILLAVIHQESRFDKDAVGADGELGLMQVMPFTAREMAKHLGMKEYNLFRVEDNIRIGTRYLIYCLNRTTRYTMDSHQNMKYGLAAYNRGITVVLNDLNRGRNPVNRYSREILETHTRIIERG